MKSFVSCDGKTLLPCERALVFALLITGSLVIWWCIFPCPKRKLHYPQAPRESFWGATAKMEGVSWSKPFATAILISCHWCHMLNSVTEHTYLMHTEMSLHPDEFDHFDIGVESDITFCLKDLRVTCLFLEACFILTHDNKCVFMQITCACEWAQTYFWSSWITVTYAFSMPNQSNASSLY